MSLESYQLPLIATMLALAFVGGVAASCAEATQEPNPEHCSRSTGDDVCAVRYGSDRPYCTIPSCDPSGEGYGGCVAEEPSPECNYACGGDRNILDDSSCVEPGDGDGDGDGDPTGDGDGDGDLPCMGPEDCTDPGAPFCDPDSGDCVSCDATAEPDTSCAEADAMTPVCLDGSCVPCAEGKVDACSGTTPICDLETNMCVGCSEHSQCPDSGACNFADGNCFDPASVVHVDGDYMNCGMSDGSEGMSFCSISEALVMTEGDPVLVLHERSLNPTAYLESTTISNTTAIFAADGESPTVQGDGGMGHAFNIAVGRSLYLRGIEITSSQAAGVVANGEGADLILSVATDRMDRGAV